VPAIHRHTLLGFRPRQIRRRLLIHISSRCASSTRLGGQPLHPRLLTTSALSPDSPSAGLQSAVVRQEPCSSPLLLVSSHQVIDEVVRCNFKLLLLRLSAPRSGKTPPTPNLAFQRPHRTPRSRSPKLRHYSNTGNLEAPERNAILSSCGPHAAGGRSAGEGCRLGSHASAGRLSRPAGDDGEEGGPPGRRLRGGGRRPPPQEPRPPETVRRRLASHAAPGRPRREAAPRWGATPVPGSHAASGGRAGDPAPPRAAGGRSVGPRAAEPPRALGPPARRRERGVADRGQGTVRHAAAP
jgi:hypothetical protein